MHLIGEQTAPPPVIGLILPGRGEPPANPPKLILSGAAPEDGDNRVIDSTTGELTSSMTLAKFARLRPLTCKPRLVSREAVGKCDTAKLPAGHPDWYANADEVRADMIEDINEATLELVGEVAELGALIGQHGGHVLAGPLREDLIDECGDVAFTASWALDAWARDPNADLCLHVPMEDVWKRAENHRNPLRDFDDDSELLRTDGNDIFAKVANTIIEHGPEVLDSPKFKSFAEMALSQCVFPASVYAGLTANAAKKMIYRRKNQDVAVEINHVMAVLGLISGVLICANSSLEEAMIRNREKLDARYPGGYRAGKTDGGRKEG